MRALRLWILGGVLSASFGAAFGCQSVAGIEERSFDGPSPECTKYCDTVMANCKGDDAVYKTQEICLDVCANLDPGDSEAGGNTVACRQAAADDAAAEKASCASAGPGGNGVCGTDCEAWCGLLEKACPEDFADLDGDCLQRCEGLSDTSDFNVSTEFYSSNTLQCRLIHVGAALSNPEAHCPHTKFNSTVTCVASGTDTPTCANLCQLTQNACDGEFAVWESEEQCLAACAVFDAGMPNAMDTNTIGCRTYHAGVAGENPEVHCRHAGPTGDGTCGTYANARQGNCESYCLLVEAACWQDPDYPFPSRADCQDACETEFADSGAEAGSNYTVETAESGHSLQCATLHAVRALEAGTNDLCAAAYGNSPCN